MKCPKCHYLGFDTGDRCKNCGYDFSFLDQSEPTGADAELTLYEEGSPSANVDLPLNLTFADEGAEPSRQSSAEDFDAGFSAPAGAPRGRESREIAAQTRSTPIDATTALRSTGGPRQDRPLPLFAPAVDEDDDTPLLRLPAAPRPPLAVRRTPDAPRTRIGSKTAAMADVATEPALAFIDDSGAVPFSHATIGSRAGLRSFERPSRQVDVGQRSGGAVRRVVAVAIDHLLLFSIDLIVVYFTLRIAGLDAGDWALLPRAPLLVFLILIKLSYFAAFTAMSGQTIGKMTTRLRVVSEEYRDIDPAQAFRRTLAGAVSVIVLGLGYVPALFGEHRALHDRVARTRVVVVESV